MPSSDRDLFDVQFFVETVDSFTESVEAHFESVARSLQDTFRDSTWIPDAVRPKTAPQSRTVLSTKASSGYFEASRDWIMEHRAITVAVVAFVSTGAFIVWRHRRSDRAKRRAKRARSGARTEVVVLAGSPHSPLTRSLTLDLERRGFIVYIPVNTISEEQMIQAESKTDIKPLSLDITSPESTEETIQKFTNYLATPQHPIPSHPPVKLRLAACILVPSPNFAVNTIAEASPSFWSDVLNTNLLAPFATVRAFLPLLISEKSTLIFLNHSIIPALTPASHSPESIVTGAMQKYLSTLRKETLTQELNVVDIRLGNFDLQPV